MRRRLLPFAWLWFLLSCSSPALVASPARLEVAPDVLEFPPTWIGYASEAEVTLTNAGLSRYEGTIEIRGPFHVTGGPFQLRGGESRRLTVRFHPDTEGPVEGALIVGAHEVHLSGIGETAPVCPPAEPCRSWWFDPATQRCEEVVEADDTPCGGTCSDSVCFQGECRISGLECDDGNSCTHDVCDPAQGCLHYDIVCQPPADPCLVAPSCDPEDGCVFQPAPDRTPCGPADCTVSLLCLQGVCTEVETLEGGRCGDETPCQEQGRCVRGECVQDPLRVLEPLWRVSVASGAELRFDGTIDDAGLLYWAECTSRGCDLVSVTVDGFPRYRVRLFDGAGRSYHGSLALVEERLISTLAPDVVEARSREAGAVLWRRSLADLVDLPQAGLRVRIAGPQVVGSDRIFLPLHAVTEEGLARAGWILALDLENGDLLWKHEEPGDFVGMVGDEHENLVYTTRRPESGAAERGEIVSRTRSGEERWRRSAPLQAPLLSYGGKALFAGGEVRQMSSGSSAGQLLLQFPSWPRRFPVWSGEVGYAHGNPLVPCGEGLCPSFNPHLIRFDGGSLDTHWALPTGPGAISEPVITRDNSVIVALGQLLVEIGEDAQEPVFECWLPPGRFEGRATLYDEIWVTATDNQVQGYLLGGRQPPARGWVGHRGGGGTTGRPK